MVLDQHHFTILSVNYLSLSPSMCVWRRVGDTACGRRSRRIAVAAAAGLPTSSFKMDMDMQIIQQFGSDHDLTWSWDTSSGVIELHPSVPPWSGDNKIIKSDVNTDCLNFVFTSFVLLGYKNLESTSMLPLYLRSSTLLQVTRAWK